MAVIYFDKKAMTVPDLSYMLPDLSMNQRVAVDTETSGKYIDGDWRAGPPARVSAVSIGWYCDGWKGCDNSIDHRHSLAMPFDQGFIGGKPGRWNDEIDGYDLIPHGPTCMHKGTTIIDKALCSCAPWNLSLRDWATLLSWLSGRPLVMHNAKFDCHIMRQGLRLVEGSGFDLMGQVVADTMLTQGIISPLHGSKLKTTASRLWPDEHDAHEQEDVRKALSKNGTGLTKRYDLIDWAVLGPYAGEDADMTIHLADHQWEKIEAGEIDTTDQGIIDVELRLCGLLYRMENKGIGLDAEGMRAEALKMETEVKAVEASLPFKPANVNAARAWFYGSKEDGGLGLLPFKTTPTCRHCGLNTETGKNRRKKNVDPECAHQRSPSMDAEVATQLAKEGHSGAREWVHLANLNSALSKWYRAWPYKCGSDGRIRTDFRQGRIEADHKGQTDGGAISGRLSATRVQTQGVPLDYRIPAGIKPVKKLFTVADGYEGWELDISNAEVRVAAWLLCSPSLAEACAGSNVHDVNCVNMFHIDEDHEEWVRYRKVAKTTILALFFNAGIRTLKGQIDKELGQNIPEREVRTFMEAAYALVPELRPVSRAMMRQADKGMGGCGYIRLVNGRRRWFGYKEKTYKAFNAGTQGGVAEIMKLWMLMVDDMYPGIIINQVHDSLWLEVPKDTASSIINGVKVAGEELFTRTFSTPDLHVPFKIDAKKWA